MGLFKRAGTAAWWCRFQVAGREIKRSTRTRDRRAAEIEERRLRAYYESRAPSRRSTRITGDLAELAGLDVERAAANGATEQHQAALEWVWERVTDYFGADAEPRVITFDSVQAYIASRRASGASDTIAREVQAMKRACVIAHRRGWLAFVPPEWPKVRRGPRSPKRRGRLHPPDILAKWLRELDGDARDEAELVLLTGLRKTEAKRLTAQWVEPAPEGSHTPALLRIPAGAAKGRTEGVIGCPARALEIIRRRAEKVPAGLPLLYQGSHETAYKLARRRIGYETPISLRDLRHTWGTLANRLVGIDAARDGLRHSNIATTNRYVSTDTARLTQASAAFAELLSRHSDAGTVPTSNEVVDAQACESVEDSSSRGRSSVGQSISLPSRARAYLDHLSRCPTCTSHVQACLKWAETDGVVGTGESAHEPTPTRRRA